MPGHNKNALKHLRALEAKILREYRLQRFLNEAPRDGNILAMLGQAAHTAEESEQKMSERIESIMKPFTK